MGSGVITCSTVGPERFSFMLAPPGKPWMAAGADRRGEAPAPELSTMAGHRGGAASPSAGSRAGLGGPIERRGHVRRMRPRPRARMGPPAPMAGPDGTSEARMEHRPRSRTCRPDVRGGPPGLQEVGAARGRGQLVPEVGVGDGDERAGALRDAPAVQLRDAPLGDDRLDMAARGDHAGALLEERHDAALRCRPSRSRAAR